MAISPPKHRSVRQGRRPSIGPTTARRRPFARRRPGAGFLPAWHPVARVTRHCVPKERFRVYAEDEFFALGEYVGELTRDGSARAAAVCGSLTDAGGGPFGARSARVASATVLFLGTGALGLVLALYVFASASHGRRKVLLRVARANTTSAAATPPVAPVRAVRRMHRVGINGRVRRRRAAIAPAGAHRARETASVSRRAAVRPGSAIATPSSAPVVPGSRVAGAEPSRPSSRIRGREGRAQATALAVSDGSTSRPGHGEFGFER